MAALGNFAGGFMQAFAAARDRKQQKELAEKELKARTTLHEIELRRAQREEMEAQKRSEAQASVSDMLAGSSALKASPNTRLLNPEGPKTLLDLLAEPAGQQALLQSGALEVKDLMQPGQQEPDAIRTLRALSADPALMEAEIRRRQAGAASTTVNLDAMGLPKPPSGYFRPNPKEPGLQLEPGGPTEREITVGASEALKSVESSEAALDKLASAAQALKDNKSLWRAVGLAGAVPSVPGSPASDLEAEIVTLQSQTAFGVLEAMRAASKTGGALGAISERELDLLQNNLASLDRSQSPEAYRKRLQAIIDYANDAKRRIRDAHKRTYGGTVISESGASGVKSQFPVIDFNDLPP